MWEQIKFNRRRTVLVWIMSGLFFLVMGYIFFLVFGPMLEREYGISRYVVIVLLVGCWIIMSFISFFWGDKLLIKISKAKKVDRTVNPRLFNVVEEMKLAAGLPVVPDVYIMPSLASNAFATGIQMENSAIIVTAGLLSKLNREELQAVIAHETAHILNRDILLLTFLGNMIGSFYVVGALLGSLMLLKSGGVGFGSNRRRRRNRRGAIFTLGGNKRSNNFSGSGLKQNRLRSNQDVAELEVGLPGRFFYLFLTRTRENLADASAARLTRNPGALASALEKIDIEKNRLGEANAVTAPMFIEAPLKDGSTHPPIEQRIKVLRAMTRGASYTDYQKAYRQVTGKTERVIPETTLNEDTRVDIKESAKSSQNSQKETTENDSGDLQNEEARQTIKDLKKEKKAVNYYDCRCGLKIRIPANIEQKKVACPRCGRVFSADVDNSEAGFNTRHFKAINFVKGLDELPEAEINHLEQDEKGNYFYEVKDDEKWESFLCQCDSLIQLSPGFSGSIKKCRDCGLTIEIRYKSDLAEKKSIAEKIGLDKNGNGFVIRGDSWQRFTCICGSLLQLSANQISSHLTCKQCGRKIKIKGKEEAQETKGQKAAEKPKTVDENMDSDEKRTSNESKDGQGLQKKIEESDLELDDDEFVYRRTGEGWESISCVCENAINLSPAFALDSISCKHCDREIRIKD